MKIPPSRIALTIAAAALAIAVGVFVRGFIGPSEGVSPTSEPATPAVVIGGPFTLVDHDGRTVTDVDFRDRHLLVFFGYTYCPDVCPTTLTTIADALDLLGEDADRLAPLFVTIDPARDTAEHMRDYVAYFHPAIIGLSGSREQIADVARAYRVFFAEVREDGADADDYLMDHSTIVYLMDEDGRFVVHFSGSTHAEDMAATIRKYL